LAYILGRGQKKRRPLHFNWGDEKEGRGQVRAIGGQKNGRNGKKKCSKLWIGPVKGNIGKNGANCG